MHHRGGVNNSLGLNGSTVIGLNLFRCMLHCTSSQHIYNEYAGCTVLGGV